ncbi:MAG: ribonucleotide reductase N-terminal alpha domain-containing protein, partial [bacterium]
MQYNAEKEHNAGGVIKSRHSQGVVTSLIVIKRSKQQQEFSIEKVMKVLSRVLRGYESVVDVSLLVAELERNIFDGISTEEIEKALVLAAQSFIERDPVYGVIAMRLLLAALYKEVFGYSTTASQEESLYHQGFVSFLERGVACGTLTPELIGSFDLAALAAALHPQRDNLFEFMGLQTIYEKYVIRVGGKRIELPQYFWMRVAMGVA